MKCSNCNNPLSDGAKFCGNCGKSVSSENLNIDNTFQPPVENKKPQSASKILKKVMRVIAVILLLGFISSNSSSSHPTNRILEDIYNVCYILAAIIFVTLLVEWWKNRKTKKEWFNWRLIIAIIFISMVGFATTIFSQALVVASQKAFGADQANSFGDSWTVYNAPENNFSIEFPSDPVRTTKNQDSPNGSIKVDSYMQADNTASIAYGVTVSLFPQDADVSDPTEILESSVTVTARNGSVITSTPTTHNGHPAINYLIEVTHPDSITRIRGLNVMVGHRLYQVFTVYDKPQETLSEYGKFVDSFQIK